MFSWVGEKSAVLTTPVLAGAAVLLFAIAPVLPDHPVHQLSLTACLYAVLILLLRNTVLVAVLLPSTVVSKMVNRDHNASLRATHVTGGSCPWTRVSIRAPVHGAPDAYADYAARGGSPAAATLTLDGCAWRHPSQRLVPDAERRWVLWINANGVAYEELLDEAPRQFGVPLEADVLVFNYRGVGESEGRPRVAMDLVRDGAAAARFLVEEMGADPRRILVHGHSMGGGAAPHVRGLLGPGPVTVDRSFARLATTAAEHARGPMGSMIASMFGAIAGMQWGVESLVHGAVPTPREWFVVTVLAALFLASVIHVIRDPDFPGSDEVRRAAKKRGKKRSGAARTAMDILTECVWAAAPSVFLANVYLIALPGPLWSDAELSLSAAFGRLCSVLVLCVAAGLSVAWSGLLSAITPQIMDFIGWGFDGATALASLQGCDRAVFWHANDVIIPRPVATATAIVDRGAHRGDGAVTVHELTLTTAQCGVNGPEGQFAHMYPLSLEKNWADTIQPMLRRLLGHDDD